MTRHIFLVAAEDSGDALGADVIDALRAADPTIRISGIGGARMADRGVASSVDMSGLAVLGFVDGIKAYKRVKQAVEAAGEHIVSANPDAVVLIDSWGFMWRLARYLKLAGAHAKRIKLVGPQVWATRPGRARVLAKWVDHLLCIFEVEQPFYKRWGLPTTVIGNPALGRLQRGDGAAFRKANALAPDTPILGLLPGSRPSEIRRVAPTLIEACAKLCATDPKRHVVCVVAPSVEASVRELARSWNFPHTLSVSEADKANAFASMDVAIACSGTVTTELAAQGAAMVVGYRLGWFTWVLARLFLWKSPYMSLVNVAAGREVAPEFLQTRFDADHIVQAVQRLLSDPAALAAQKQGQAAAIAKMAGTGKPASAIAAETIIALTPA